MRHRLVVECVAGLAGLAALAVSAIGAAPVLADTCTVEGTNGDDTGANAFVGTAGSGRSDARGRRLVPARGSGNTAKITG